MGGGQSTTEAQEEEQQTPPGSPQRRDNEEESSNHDSKPVVTPSKPIISPKRRTVQTPKKAKDASNMTMDVAINNKVVFSNGGEISFMPTDRDEIISGWAPKHKNNAVFSPRQIVLQDESKKTFLLSPNRTNTVNIYDTERGTSVAELNVRNTMKDIDMPIDTFVTEHKYDQLRSMGDVMKNVAISGNMVFTLQHDLRTKPDDVIITEKAEVKTRGLGFTCVATTAKGDVVVGTTVGELKLYTNPAKNGWHQAKTQITQLTGSIVAVDVSEDCEWIVATQKDSIALINVAFRDPRTNEMTTGFETKIPAEERKSVMVLRLSADDAQAMNMAEGSVVFQKARFDTSTSANLQGVVEEFIVTACGPYIISWNFRQLALDYKKLQKEDRVNTKVRPKIIFLEKPVVDTAFEWGQEPVVVAATADALSRLSLQG